MVSYLQLALNERHTVLYQVERGWRDMKGALALGPAFHHREDRIRAHVQLSWLALLLIRACENATGESWRCVREELQRMHLVTPETSEDRVARRSRTDHRPAPHPRRPGASRAAALHRLRGQHERILKLSPPRARRSDTTASGFGARSRGASWQDAPPCASGA